MEDDLDELLSILRIKLLSCDDLEEVRALSKRLRATLIARNERCRRKANAESIDAPPINDEIQ
jgi:hypothetical protein